MIDNRVFGRVAVNLPVQLIDLDRNRELDANTCDVSAKGIGIVIKESLMPGDPLELWLKMPERKEPFYTRGMVVWTQALKDNAYRAGVCLEKAEFMGMSQVFNA